MRNLARHLAFLVVIPVALLAGCATPSSMALSPANKSSIKTVHIDKNVAKPANLYWRGAAQAWGGALFGAVGAIATANAGMSDAERMQQFMDKQHIDISQLVYAEASKQAAAKNMFQLSDGDKTDATLILSVDMYGFSKTHAFGTHMNPLIRVTGRLAKPNNEIVWQESEFVSDFASENDQGQSLDTYTEQPETLRAALAKASEVAVKRILAKLE